MLLLLFYLGDEMYTIKCEKVREVAPMVRLKEISQAPEFVVGLLNYRGVIVPVIDLRRLIQGKSCEMRLSTRIILVDFERQNQAPYTIGLMAERVTETVRKTADAFLPSGVVMDTAPYLKNVVMLDEEMIQFIDLDLLPRSLQFVSIIEE